MEAYTAAAREFNRILEAYTLSKQVFIKHGDLIPGTTVAQSLAVALVTEFPGTFNWDDEVRDGVHNWEAPAHKLVFSFAEHMIVARPTLSLEEHITTARHAL